MILEQVEQIKYKQRSNKQEVGYACLQSIVGQLSCSGSSLESEQSDSASNLRSVSSGGSVLSVYAS